MNSRTIVSPWGRYNQELVAQVHPLDWKNPKPASRYNRVVMGAGTAGLVCAAGAAGLGAKVALIERNLMGEDCLNAGCVSDVFADRRVPKDLQTDPVLYGECLGGSLYIEDFRRLLRTIGCLDYRVVSRRKIMLDNPEIEAKAGMIGFYSMTIRIFKLSDLEDICEDYGQAAVYLGTIPDFPHLFDLDDHHNFVTGKPMLVCGNTASMVGRTRYGRHFKVIGDRSTHFGPFDCRSIAAKQTDRSLADGGSCC